MNPQIVRFLFLALLIGIYTLLFAHENNIKHAEIMQHLTYIEELIK